MKTTLKIVSSAKAIATANCPPKTASYSRPRVSNDNLFSEALFRTCKYRPNWPTKGFATEADAQAW